MAAKKLGIADLPTVEVSHLSDAQIKAFRIADNQLCRMGSWNDRVLAETFEELSKLELDFSLEITGFSMPEIDVRISTLHESPVPDDPDDEPVSNISGPPVCKPGDLWLLGHHRVVCADSRDPKSYAALMQKGTAAGFFTDPPYNVKIEGNVSGLGKMHHSEFPMASGEMTDGEYSTFLENVIRQLPPHCRDGAVLFVCIDWRHLLTLLLVAQKLELSLLNLAVWVKHLAGMGSFYRSQHEIVAIFKAGGGRHLNNVKLGRHGRSRSNVWQYPGANNFGRGLEGDSLAKHHPTPKPVAMIADALLDCTARGDIVLDAFLGSGSTLLAAERTGRRCYGLEIDPLYVDLTIRRWQRKSGKTATCAESGKTFDELQSTQDQSS